MFDVGIFNLLTATAVCARVLLGSAFRFVAYRTWVYGTRRLAAESEATLQ